MIAAIGARAPRWGLALNFIGSVLVGLAGYFGLAAGYGGAIVWLHPLWAWAWRFGWFLLAAGFAVQWWSTRETGGGLR